MAIKNFIANLVKSPVPEAYIDRRGGSKAIFWRSSTFCAASIIRPAFLNSDRRTPNHCAANRATIGRNLAIKISRILATSKKVTNNP